MENKKEETLNITTNTITTNTITTKKKRKRNKNKNKNKKQIIEQTEIKPLPQTEKVYICKYCYGTNEFTRKTYRQHISTEDHKFMLDHYRTYGKTMSEFKSYNLLSPPKHYRVTLENVKKMVETDEATGKYIKKFTK